MGRVFGLVSVVCVSVMAEMAGLGAQCSIVRAAAAGCRAPSGHAPQLVVACQLAIEKATARLPRRSPAPPPHPPPRRCPLGQCEGAAAAAQRRHVRLQLGPCNARS
jgi:hypothetical protein